MGALEAQVSPLGLSDERINDSNKWFRPVVSLLVDAKQTKRIEATERVRAHLRAADGN